MISEFVESEEKDIKQFKDHFEMGFEKGQKGMLKRVHTDRILVMSLVIPGVETMSHSFLVDQSRLDSVGFVVDYFRGIAIEGQEKGTIMISEAREGSDFLWYMDVHWTVPEMWSQAAYGKSYSFIISNVFP